VEAAEEYQQKAIHERILLACHPSLETTARHQAGGSLVKVHLPSLDRHVHTHCCMEYIDTNIEAGGQQKPYSRAAMPAPWWAPW